MFLPGEIVIASFPFSSLAGVKRRPCVVLAAGNTAYDFVVAFMTTAAAAAKQTGLKAFSVIRADKLVTLNDSVISGARRAAAG
jgi:hypothetical protein